MVEFDYSTGYTPVSKKYIKQKVNIRNYTVPYDFKNSLTAPSADLLFLNCFILCFISCSVIGELGTHVSSSGVVILFKISFKRGFVLSLSPLSFSKRVSNKAKKWLNKSLILLLQKRYIHVPFIPGIKVQNIVESRRLELILSDTLEKNDFFLTWSICL